MDIPWLIIALVVIAGIVALGILTDDHDAGNGNGDPRCEHDWQPGLRREGSAAVWSDDSHSDYEYAPYSIQEYRCRKCGAIKEVADNVADSADPSDFTYNSRW